MPISGIALSNIDRSVRPQDDLYQHVNGAWLKDTTIPDDRALEGTFTALRDGSELAVREIIEEAAAKGSEASGIEQKIGRNFSIGMEYMFHQYQDNDYRVRVTGAAGTPFTNGTNGGTTSGTDFRRGDDNFRWHSLRATAAFRF